ncbi:hypothetical protein GUITHDRAFT_114782 [Guillardia theta CCMP2712]|uniref:Uncharacterized protein n=1 Tax=Guillardia theta (strain CCMP2712) TaxID=905079 RepID=L1IS76_GUITC|nr:hypothetical protein GUITHDRAFT_114782 [Guillardia theta CCMP2712]EKX39121.1 hypothetical protein GUITHDRAFT_114782 [Guillardia theta CCMP2712]|eukprot:XP_005826101.1 hypothetical protein GUITHDRAFT_114782 [Guillardia theta CCMP2712]
MGEPSVWAAARVGDEDTSASFPVVEESGPDARDEDGRTALHWASTVGNERVVENLLSCGADITIGSLSVLKVLLQACQNRGEECLLNIRTNEYRHSLLHFACMKNRTNIVEMLLDEYGMPINDGDSTGSTPLILATRIGSLSILQALLQRGADVHGRDLEGNTTFHFACEILKDSSLNNELAWSTIQLLLEHGASPIVADISPVDELSFEAARMLSRMQNEVRKKKNLSSRSEAEQSLLEQEVFEKGRIGADDAVVKHHDNCRTNWEKEHDEDMCTRVYL